MLEELRDFIMRSPKPAPAAETAHDLLAQIRDELRNRRATATV